MATSCASAGRRAELPTASSSHCTLTSLQSPQQGWGGALESPHYASEEIDAAAVVTQLRQTRGTLGRLLQGQAVCLCTAGPVSERGPPPCCGRGSHPGAQAEKAVDGPGHLVGERRCSECEGKNRAQPAWRGSHQGRVGAHRKLHADLENDDPGGCRWGQETHYIILSASVYL